MDNQIDNIVPVLAIENKYSLQQAIDDACKLVQEARMILDDAEKRVPVPTGNPELRTDAGVVGSEVLAAKADQVTRG